MSNTSTAAVDGKLLRLVDEAENFNETTAKEVVYMRSLLSAIEALVKLPGHNGIIEDLASLGQWVADNVDGSFSHFNSQVHTIRREMH